MKIILHDDHGGEHDVTEHVRSLYGHTTGSMDWGSGFLDGDEMLEVQEFGYLSGFEEGDLDKAVASAEREAVRCRELAGRPTYSAYGHPAEAYRASYVREAVAKEKYLAGLQAIRNARARLFAQTDDVTNFDEEVAS